MVDGRGSARISRDRCEATAKPVGRARGVHRRGKRRRFLGTCGSHRAVDGSRRFEDDPRLAAGLPHPMALRDYDPRAERVQGPEGHGLQKELSVRTRPRSPGYGALSRARAPVVRWPGRAGTLGHSPARSSVSRPAALGGASCDEEPSVYCRDVAPPEWVREMEAPPRGTDRVRTMFVARSASSFVEIIPRRARQVETESSR